MRSKLIYGIWKGRNEMDNLMKILYEMDESIDWENEKHLIDDRIMDSFLVISLLSELEEHYEIEIDASELIPENLNSAEAIWNMVQKLKEN